MVVIGINPPREDEMLDLICEETEYHGHGVGEKLAQSIFTATPAVLAVFSPQRCKVFVRSVEIVDFSFDKVRLRWYCYF